MRTLAFGAAAALLLTCVSAQAATIDSTGGVSTSDIQPFGSPDTATYGQTFVATGSTLNSFSMFLGESVGGPLAPLDFKGYIGTWDGTKLGSVLYTSGTLNKNTDATLEYAFNTGNLAVTMGNTYVAFLSLSDLALQGNATYGMPSVANTIAGNFVYMNNGTNFGDLSLNAWDEFVSLDVHFKASFDGGVPEPSTWAMMLAGFGLIGAAMRRRAKGTVRFA